MIPAWMRPSISKVSRPKYVVIKLDEEEAKVSGWKAGYYQIDLTPVEVITRLGEPYVTTRSQGEGSRTHHHGMGLGARHWSLSRARCPPVNRSFNRSWKHPRSQTATAEASLPPMRRGAADLQVPKNGVELPGRRH